jgi:hypothetical protein
LLFKIIRGGKKHPTISPAVVVVVMGVGAAVIVTKTKIII